jgi:enoyl-CoA hydratase/carnithine racemase
VRGIGPALTKELVITCREFSPAEARAAGFLNRVVAATDLDASVDDLNRSRSAFQNTDWCRYRDIRSGEAPTKRRIWIRYRRRDLYVDLRLKLTRVSFGCNSTPAALTVLNPSANTGVFLLVRGGLQLLDLHAGIAQC